MSHLRAGLLLAVGCLLLSFAASAATPAPAAGALAPLFNAPAPVSIGTGSIPANTVVELELVDAVGSEISHKGDFFKLRVAQPVIVDGKELIPAGTIAVGQVVHAAKAGMGGKAGELLLAGRYLDLPTGQVKLHSSFGVAGQGHVVGALVLSTLVGPFGLVVHGKRVELPPGTRISARIAPANQVPASATPAPSPAPVSTAPTAGSAASASP